jgi:predicted DsbA family dithiol-disulfide isomerase
MPKTRRPLAMAEYARDHGKLSEFRGLAMDAHWKDGKDIEDGLVLRELALAAGLDPEMAVTAADNSVYLKRVDDMRLEYRGVGVGGIPTFVFGGEVVEGCQPYPVLAGAAARAGAMAR